MQLTFTPELYHRLLDIALERTKSGGYIDQARQERVGRNGFGGPLPAEVVSALQDVMGDVTSVCAADDVISAIWPELTAVRT